MNFKFLLSISLVIFSAVSIEAQMAIPEVNPEVKYCKVDNDLIKVTDASGNYFHVKDNGLRHGDFSWIQSIDNPTIVSAKGQMNNGKYIGRVNYLINGEIALIRVYDEIGNLTKTIRIHDNVSSISSSLASN